MQLPPRTQLLPAPHHLYVPAPLARSLNLILPIDDVESPSEYKTKKVGRRGSGPPAMRPPCPSQPMLLARSTHARIQRPAWAEPNTQLPPTPCQHCCTFRHEAHHLNFCCRLTRPTRSLMATWRPRLSPPDRPTQPHRPPGRRSPAAGRWARPAGRVEAPGCCVPLRCSRLPCAFQPVQPRGFMTCSGSRQYDAAAPFKTRPPLPGKRGRALNKDNPCNLGLV